MKNKLYSNQYILNVNFPKKYMNGFIIKKTIQDLYKDKDLLTDISAIVQGFISITPLTIDRTDYNVFDSLDI